MPMLTKKSSISDLVGKTVTSMRKNRVEEIKALDTLCEFADNDVLTFACADGSKYYMRHRQDGGEAVYLDDSCGDLEWLIGTPILSAEESASNDNPKSITDESATWTFYRITTVKGTIVLRWYGSSNGYYSEAVSFDEVINDINTTV